MKQTIITLALCALTLGACTNKQQEVEPDGAYLFTYFNDPTHSLFMAISYDGYEFKAINGTAFATRTSTADPTTSSIS